MDNLYNIVCDLLQNVQFKGIENRITRTNFHVEVKDIKIMNNFFYINFNGDKITEDKLVDVLDDLLVFYCIPRTEIVKVLDLYSKTGQLRDLLNSC